MEHIERLGDLTALQLRTIRATDYVRLLSCAYAGDGSAASPLERFAARYPRSLSLATLRKAAVAVGTTTDATWAGPLAVAQPLAADFVALVRAASLIGRIPGLREVPFNVSLPAQTSGGTYSWTGAGRPKPVSAAAFATVALTLAKATGILVLTRELLELSKPGAEPILRDELVKGVSGFLDGQFIAPSVAANPNVSPASVTFAATPIASSGTTAAAARVDIIALARAFLAAHPDAANAVVLLSPGNAIALSVSGSFPDLRATGGLLAGLTAVVSAAVGDNLVMLDPTQILVALDNIEIDISTTASVEMESSPADPAVAGTAMRSFYQEGMAGLKVTAFANWKLAKAGAVQVVTGAAYA